MYTAIIFDFFGLFCPDITMEWFKKSVPDYESKFAQYQAICTESDYGKLSRADFNVRIAELTGVPIDEMTRGFEAEMIINTSLISYVKDLRARGYQIACLSNGTHEWTLRVISDHGLQELFDKIILSGDLGIVKPDRRIYEHTLAQMQVAAEQSIFADDRKINTDAAETCGIRSLVFTSTDAFVTELEALLVK